MIIGLMIIGMVVFKHMHGNMVEHFSKLERFCEDSTDNDCEDVLWIKQQNNLISYEPLNVTIATGLYSKVSNANTTVL